MGNRQGRCPLILTGSLRVYTFFESAIFCPHNRRSLVIGRLALALLLGGASILHA
jgi:hypothetical protein